MYYTAIKHVGNWKTREKYRKHEQQASDEKTRRLFYVLFRLSKSHFQYYFPLTLVLVSSLKRSTSRDVRR